MKNIILVAFTLISFHAIAQQKSVLFLGNSYTATSNLPTTLYNLAAAGGDTIIHDRNTPGGYTLEGHSTNATSLSKISSRDWDFVVLQEQSQKPSFPPAQVAAETFPYAEILVDSIKSNYECTEPIFFMTWGRRDGDQQNCQFYTPLCTFEGMNARLRESYMEMAENNDATVAPCGAAWKELHESDNASWSSLYSGDGSHPSAKGTYLNACVFYATMFRQSPVGIPYYANLAQQEAEQLQQLAADIVIDSLENWFIGHQDVGGSANFSLAGGLSVNFSGQSENTSEVEWLFGDGQTSNELNTEHSYTLPGTYQVSFIVSSECDSDTTDFELTVNETDVSVNDPHPIDNVNVSFNQNRLTIDNPTEKDLVISIVDAQGRLLMLQTLSSKSVQDIGTDQVNGFFLVNVDDGENRISKRFVQIR